VEIGLALDVSAVRTNLGARTPTAQAILFYAAFALCVTIVTFTNDVIIALIRDLTGRGADWPVRRTLQYASGDYHGQYLLASLKNAAFFACVILFGFLLRGAVAPLVPALRQRKLWADVIIALLIASIFLCEIVPNGMGSIYGNLSLDPFVQEQGFYHRRILMPALAHLLHLGGVLYGLFYWAVALGVLALSSIYLVGKGLVLSRLELASLYTIGIFATALGLPGYAEILVLGLTLLAMLDFDRHGRTGVTQPVCFALALLTHETAAVLAFGTLALCLFDRRFFYHFTVLLALYLLIWLASYGFDLDRATTIQLAGGKSNAGQFARTLPLVLFSLIAAYKLTLLAAVPAVIGFVAARQYRMALLIVLGLGGSVALTAIATDYTRMMAFGSFAILIALAAVLPRLSRRVRIVLATINLLLPTVYVSAYHGAVAYHGLYGLLLTRVFGMRG
jgi:hypothetical protein